ncbi:MAG: TrbG/VirB9 family P-type conjugative transfer protein [Georgfuchsia sp.]
MRHRKIFAVLFAISLSTHAGQKPVDLLPESREPAPMPSDTRLVKFTYDENDTYSILAMPGAITHIELHKDELVSALAIGDSTQWQVQKKDNNLFIKPTRAGLFTSATLVTNQRTYQLMLRSSPEAGKWYQRVSWNYPDLIIMAGNEAAFSAARASETAIAAAPKADSSLVGNGVSISALSFDYELKGSAPFRPAQVFDDGTFTYIKFARRPQEMPPLFVKINDGFALANYTFEPENMIKVHRLFDMAILKIGAEEVTIKSTRRDRK